MKKINIEWKHYDKDGKTCIRCSITGDNIHKAINQIQNELESKEVDIDYHETKLPESRMSESNQIIVNGILIEKLLPNTYADKNYCNSCSDLIDNPKGCKCRIIKQDKNVYEAIPVDLIRQAIFNLLPTERSSMKIQVLGSGCSTCKKLYEHTQEAAKQLNLKTKVEYITDVSKIVEMGVMTSPVLAVNNIPIMVGTVSSVEKIKSLLTKNTGGSNKTRSVCSCGSDCC